MRLSYDLDAGALYIELGDREVALTRQVDDNTLVDLDEGGNVVGIEVTATGHPWGLESVLGTYKVPGPEAAQLRAYFGQTGHEVQAPQVSADRIPAVCGAT